MRPFRARRGTGDSDTVSVQWRAATAALAARDRAIRTLIVGAVVAGPALGGWALVAAGTTSHGSTAPSATAGSDGPSGFAALYVSAWLQAGKGTEDTLRAYYPAATSLTRPAGTRTAPRIVTLAATETTPGYWSVQVAADQMAASSSGWQPAGIHCYQVAVAVTGPVAFGGPADTDMDTPIGYVATGLPAELSCPANLDLPAPDYDLTVAASSGPIAETLRAFLGAYLAGAADVDRYTTPGAHLAAVTPAPYSEVDLDSIALRGSDGAELDTDVVAADGTAIEVLAQIEATSLAGEDTPMTYVLTLTARAGRWEVTTIEPGPALSEQPTPPTAAADPTGPAGPSTTGPTP